MAHLAMFCSISLSYSLTAISSACAMIFTNFSDFIALIISIVILALTYLIFHSYFFTIERKIIGNIMLSNFDDLNEKFQPITSILPQDDNCSDTLLILSSIKNVHAIPYEILNPFERFQTIYHDFSIMSAINRKVPCTTVPVFEDSN